MFKSSAATRETVFSAFYARYPKLPVGGVVQPKFILEIESIERKTPALRQKVQPE